MDVVWPFVPFLVAVALLVGWFWFFTRVGPRYDIRESLEGYRQTRPLFRMLVVLGYLGALSVNLGLWITRSEPYTGFLMELLLVFLGLSLFFLFFWVALGTKQIGLLHHLVLNRWLYGKYVRKEVVEDPELMVLIRQRVKERLWFHRAMFRLKRLSVADILEEICGRS